MTQRGFVLELRRGLKRAGIVFEEHKNTTTWHGPHGEEMSAYPVDGADGMMFRIYNVQPWWAVWLTRMLTARVRHGETICGDVACECDRLPDVRESDRHAAPRRAREGCLND